MFQPGRTGSWRTEFRHWSDPIRKSALQSKARAILTNDDISAPWATMLAFAQDAAAVALERRAAGLALSHKGEGFGQALTDADAAISAMMRDRFGSRLIEEETAAGLDPAAAKAMLRSPDAWTFVGDPIDGTAPFAAGLPGWGTMIAVCRDGWPAASVIVLPAWIDERDRFDEVLPPDRQRGLLIGACAGRAYFAPTRAGRMIGPLKPLPAPNAFTRHVGWLPVAARHYTLDYTRGFFPLSESGYVADAAALAIGRSDATTFNHKLWDLVPTLPILEALGFALFRWPDLAGPPREVAALFNTAFECHPDLWLICRSPEQAAALGDAIARARP